MDTKIEWADKAWNPVTGCTKISPGCKNCYAERMSKRLKGRNGYPADDPFRVTVHPDRLGIPLKWKKPRRVFVNSMGDLFHKDVPFWFIDSLMRKVLIQKQHDFLILTKRPYAMKNYFLSLFQDGEFVFRRSTNGEEFLIGQAEEIPIKNVWLGVTAEDQAQADNRIPVLLKIPAAVLFVSVEPMLSMVNIPAICSGCGKKGETATIQQKEAGHVECPDCWDTKQKTIDWVICGGESGPGARCLHPEFVKSLRDQCIGANVPFFFKSWGDWAPFSVDLEKKVNTKQRLVGDQFRQEGPCALAKNPVTMYKVGKKRSGNLLEYKTWEQFPLRKR